MALHAHVESLQSKHAKLEDAVLAESTRPMPDFAYVTMLKKQKLLVKEELERLSLQGAALQEDSVA